MERDGKLSNRWWKAILILGLWTLIGLSFASQFYLSSSLFGRSVTWGAALRYALADWYVWAVLSWVIWRLGMRFPLARGIWKKHVIVHAVCCLLVSGAYMVIRAWVAQVQSRLAGDPVAFAAVFKPLLVKTFHFNVLIYWVILSVRHAIDYYAKYHERERNTLELEKRLTQAKLQALLMQLNPHFLFNTLHGISALMHKDVEAADKMLTRLSDLLRLTLDQRETQLVPLAQELEVLNGYLEIERLRFGERLEVARQFDTPSRQALVPHLILQPLVENAIRHGIEKHSRPGRIEIRAWREQDHLKLQVRDNGPGMKNAKPLREGIGLSNSRLRLRELYGDNQRFELEEARDGGFIARLTIPYQPAELAANNDNRKALTA